MQGTIFTAFSDMVIEKIGMECWNELLDKTKPASQGIYTAGEQYKDGELIEMVKLLSKKTGIAINDLLTAFGEYIFETLYQNSPADLSSLTNLKDFLLAIDGVIHSEVKRVHPSAYLPSFKYHNSENGDLILEYSSKRKLCYLAVGLIQGAAAKFSEKISISHPVCMHKGADHCELIIHFQG
ncbi:heme NO-binding domain-containing protein [Colwelliaceae bacterium MEBiC 14330]